MPKIRREGHIIPPAQGRNRVLRSPNQMSPPMLWGEQRIAEIVQQTPNPQRANLAPGPIPAPTQNLLLQSDDPVETERLGGPGDATWFTFNTSGKGIVAGDLLVAMMHADQYSGFTFNGELLTPSGWTEAGQYPASVNTRRCAIFYRQADAGDVAGTNSYAFQIRTTRSHFSNQNYAWGGGYRVQRVPLVTATGTAVENGSFGAGPASYSLTASSEGDWGLVIGAAGASFAGSTNPWEQTLSGASFTDIFSDAGVTGLSNGSFNMGVAAVGTDVDVAHSGGGGTGFDQTSSLLAIIPIT